MIANWLSNNMSKIGRIVCSAGMMVPWLLPSSAMACTIHYYSVSVPCDYATPGAAMSALDTEGRNKCSSKNKDYLETTGNWSFGYTIWGICFKADGTARCVSNCGDDGDDGNGGGGS